MIKQALPQQTHLVRLPPQLAGLSERTEVSLIGETTWEVLQSLRTELPLVGQELLDADGRLLDFVAVFVNARRQTREQVRSTRLEVGSTVTLLLAAAGG